MSDAKVIDKLDTLIGLVKGMDTRLVKVEADVATLKADVAGLKTDVAGLKTEVAGLKTEVIGLKTEVAIVKADIGGLKDRMDKLEFRMFKLEEGQVATQMRVSNLEGRITEQSQIIQVAIAGRIPRPKSAA